MNRVQVRPAIVDRNPPSLRRTWAASAVQSFGIVVILGLMTFGLTWYSHDVYRDATVHAESEIGALTELKAALLTVSTTATPVLYRFDGAGTAAQNLQRYAVASRELTALLHDAETTFREDHTRQALPRDGR